MNMHFTSAPTCRDIPFNRPLLNPQLLTLNKHCYLSPSHITLITASPIDGKDPSHDSFRWTFCPLPDKHQIPKAFVFAWPHESGKLLQSRHMPCLLFCWLPANLAKEGLELKNTEEHLCSVYTALFWNLLSLLQRAWQQPEPTVWLMKVQRLKKKETKQPTTSFKNIQCLLLRNTFIIRLFQ